MSHALSNEQYLFLEIEIVFCRKSYFLILILLSKLKAVSCIKYYIWLVIIKKKFVFSTCKLKAFKNAEPKTFGRWILGWQYYSAESKVFGLWILCWELYSPQYEISNCQVTVPIQYIVIFQNSHDEIWESCLCSDKRADVSIVYWKYKLDRQKNSFVIHNVVCGLLEFFFTDLQ